MPEPNIIQTGYLDTCDITNYHTIHSMKLTELGDKREIYFLGENGDGKTLILQGIVFALKHHFIENELKNSEVGAALDLIRKNNPHFRGNDHTGHSYNDHSETFLDALSEFNKPRGLVPTPELYNTYGPIYAYGVYRGLSIEGGKPTHGFMSLFDKTPLRHPSRWLQKIDYAQHEGKATLSLNTAKNLLRQLLDEDLDIQVSSEGVVYKERGSELDLEQLSEGYRSVMTWVLDLLANLSEAQPKVTRLQDYQGIVLVDEIGLHLHPKWEMKIVSQLRKWFSGIQFFFTTHSPITVMGASYDAIFYKVYKESGETRVSEPYRAHDMRKLMANGIVTSPLFDLEAASMLALGDERPDTRSNWLHSRIAEAVSDEVKAMKKRGEIYVDPKKIDALIKRKLQDFKGKQQ